MSYWQTDDKIPISQKSISIPSQNGLEYSAGQRIIFEIPPSVEFIQPRECYLRWDVQLKLPSGKLPTKLQLDETLGAQSLIKDIRIYSGGAGKILLEELQNYNVLTNVKYTYETNDVLRKKRALTEGSTYHSVATRGTCGGTESHKNNVIENPYFKVKSGATSTAWSDDDFLKVKCLLPIQTGIFQNSKVFPVMMTEGLQIDILLEDNNKVMRQLDQCMRLKRHTFMPIYHSVNGSLEAPDATGTATDFQTIFLANDNMIKSVESVPFCVGEEIQFVDLATGTPEVPSPVCKIATISACATNGLIQLDFTAAGQVAVDITTLGTFGVCSHVVEGYGASSYDATYTLSDCQLVLQQLEMPQGYKNTMMKMMKEGGSMNYDFLSFTNYKYSQLAGDIVANIRLPLNMSRAKAILSVPTDATTYNSSKRITGVDTYTYFDDNDFTGDRQMNSDKSGLVGIIDRLQDYQFFYDGKLNPSRKVDVSKTATQMAVGQQGLIELEKALSMSNIVPYSFLGFQENFVIGRALSLHNGVYDTRNKDFNLQVEYTNLTPTKNKLWHNFVSHIRRIEFTANGISLQV